MLCDDLVADFGRRYQNQEIVIPLEVAAKNLLQPLLLSQRFVLSPLVVETAEQLADPEKVEATRDYLFTPAKNTWIEWREGSVGWERSNRHGLFLIGRGADKTNLVIGEGAYVFDVHDSDFWPSKTILYLPISYDLVSGEILTVHDDSETMEEKAKRIRDRLPPSMKNRVDQMIEDQTFDQQSWAMKKLHSEIDQKKLGAFLGATLALINTPRLSQRTLHEPDKALQKAREKKKKLPLLSWQEITICVDRGELGHGEQKSETGERAFHHVRAHLRLKMGKVELVKPHWRGNPEKGVIQHRHVVTRVEDEAGEWKGGPLPPPKIIKELQ